VKKSCLSPAELSWCLGVEYGMKLTLSALSHGKWSGTDWLQLVLQIPAVCGVEQIEIKRPG
jgi:hypothetical protein